MSEEFVKLDRDYIGKKYSSGPHIVEPESIRQYALATNETNPSYFHPDSHGKIVSPPLYPVVFIPMFRSLLAEDADKIGLDMLRLVHSQHKLTWRDLLYSGDQIYITATIANMKVHGVHDTMDLEIQIMRDNEPIIEMLYQMLIRGQKRAGVQKKKKHVQDLELGQKLGEQSMSVTMDQGVRYAKASGDHNPIHINEEIAKRAGFPRTIVHGLCTMAISSKAIVDELLDGYPTRIKSMSARFSRPVLMGQTLTTELYVGGSLGEHSTIHYITKNPEGVPVITHGVAEFSD